MIMPIKYQDTFVFYWHSIVAKIHSKYKMQFFPVTVQSANCQGDARTTGLPFEDYYIVFQLKSQRVFPLDICRYFLYLYKEMLQ